MRSLAAILLCCLAAAASAVAAVSAGAEPQSKIAVAADGRGFVETKSGKAFFPWGMNYGHGGRFMEDFWDTDWETLAKDFRDLRAMGANVVRVHLQFGRFMAGPAAPRQDALRQFERLVQLATEVGIYLDVTGLACYRPADVPAWYDALDEPGRWSAQANFWAAIARAGAGQPAIFCYDLMNEPISPSQKREAGRWRSGQLFGGYDFVQYIALEPAGRSRDKIVAQWLEKMIGAIRLHDSTTLITVGLLPWSEKWKHLSGFVPEKIAPPLDFISVHLYPRKDQPAEAMEALRHAAIGRPVVIEEVFPLHCGVDELEAFLRDSRALACGWIGHYDGLPPREAEALQQAGRLTLSQAVYLSFARLFIGLGPEFTGRKD